MTSRAVILAVTLCLAGCAVKPEVDASRDDVERAVKNWLYCDECWNRQFEHLVALGPQAIPVLRRYVDARRETSCREGDKAQKLADLFDRVNDSGVVRFYSSRDEFVARHLRAHCDRLQHRAAAAIAAIDRSELPRDVAYRRRALVVRPGR